MSRRETDAARVLHVMLIYDDPTDGRAEGVIFTAQQLGNLTQIGLNRARDALVWLLRGSYVYRDRGAMRVTMDGRAYWEACQRRPVMSRELNAWKDEVLTGITPAGRRSRIENAAMPNHEGHPHCDTTPEDIMARQQIGRNLKRRMAQELHLTSMQFDKFLLEGRIQVCTGTRENPAEEHIGVFARNGERWMHICNRCRGRERKRWSDEKKEHFGR